MALQKLGKYEPLEELGRGGYGTVYRARETVLDVERAVKVLHPALVSDPEFIERFRREAKFAARIDHPHIVPVYELGEVEGVYFLVMKYMPGGSLKEIIAEQGRLPFERSLEIIRQIAEALDFAHARPEKLIHRDVKPGNVLFETEDHVRLSDFGFAKALSGTRSASLSASGGMIGTPPYMAPEVWRGKDVTPATDVYSLACVFYEMITGEVLFDGESPPEIMTRHMLDGPQFPENWFGDTPKSLTDMLTQALAMNAEERYPGAVEFMVAMTKLETPVQERERLEEEEKAKREAEAQARRDAKEAAQRQAEEKAQREDKARSPVRPEAVRKTSASQSLPVKRPWWQQGWLWFGIVFVLMIFGLVYVNSLKPSPQPTEVSVTDDYGISMALVPAGSFEMGSKYLGGDANTVHTIMLDAYYIDQYEVSNAHYAECVDAGVCDPPSETASSTRSSYYGNSSYDDYPVIYVDWFAAQTYCEWRGARLPTEAEWEKAARGGLEGKLYPWGDTFDGNRANSCDKNCEIHWANHEYNDGYADTAPVGNYAPNGYGLYDMAGNVFEWTADWYDENYYHNSPSSNPEGPASGEYRVLRDGSWRLSESNLIIGIRWNYDPSVSDEDTGFRCASSQ